MTMRHVNCSNCLCCRHLGRSRGARTTQQLPRCKDGIHLCNEACAPPSVPRGAGVRVRLTRRLANCIDGVNLSTHAVGDVFDVTRHDAELLIAEGWAVPVFVPRARSPYARAAVRFDLEDPRARRHASLAGQLRDIRSQIERRSFQPHDHRRAEDRIRDAWHDEHARILNDLD
jgi:hypothetical protein